MYIRKGKSSAWSSFCCVFEIVCDTYGRVILILSQSNLSKQYLLRFLCLKIKIFYRVCCETFEELQHEIGSCRTLS